MEHIGTRRDFVFYCNSPKKIEQCEKKCLNNIDSPVPCENACIMQHWE